MLDKQFYAYLRKQIPVIAALSLFPGLGYIFLAWMHDIHLPAMIWYGLIVLVSVWGYYIYRQPVLEEMGDKAIASWYRQLSYFYYTIFFLWAVIFLIYVRQDTYKLHYIAIFTELGASVVASALLISDRKLFTPIIIILMAPLVVYFFNIGEWYGYVLTVFASIFTWVLFYAASGSNLLLQKTSYQAAHDLLTGLRNRHFFIEHLQRMMNSLQKTDNYSYLLLIDLDHFKTINDTHGHETGDTVLKEFGNLLRNITRNEDIACRYGGEEFVICLPGADQSTATTRAELIRETMSTLSFHHEGNKINPITVSIGISVYPDHGENTKELIRTADKALYEAKKSGRNRVIIAHSSTVLKKFKK